MSNINRFAKSSFNFATDEDFNLIFWFFYAGLIIILLSLLPLAVLPPVAVVFVVLAAAPALFYIGLWAVVGVASLISHIEKKLDRAPSVHFSFHSGPTDSPEPLEAPKFQEAPTSVVADPEFTASAAQYSNPLSGQTYTDPHPVEYGQPIYPTL